MIGVKKCGEFHTKARRTEHGGGRWKKHDGSSPVDRAAVLADRRHHRRKAKQDVAAEASDDDAYWDNTDPCAGHHR